MPVKPIDILGVKIDFARNKLVYNMTVIEMIPEIFHITLSLFTNLIY